MKFAL